MNDEKTITKKDESEKETAEELKVKEQAEVANDTCCGSCS